jgi:hypothetical protein
MGRLRSDLTVSVRTKRRVLRQALTLCCWGILSSIVACPAASPNPHMAERDAQAAAPPLVIKWDGDHLSVSVREAPWEEVLNELQRQTGAWIQVKGSVPGTLTQELGALPLEQGLRRLFRQANVLWFYSQGSEPGAAGERLVRVWLFPKEDTAPEEMQVRSLSSGFPAAGKRAMPDIVEKAVEGVPRADETHLEDDGKEEKSHGGVFALYQHSGLHGRTRNAGTG